MSAGYKAVIWNRQKRIYDTVLAIGVTLYLVVFIGAGAVLHPTATIETLIIRATSTAAFLLLHIILAIGPLCRLNKRFLPLLYNRRHLGVTMFLLALIHGVFSIVQFHAFGDVNPLVSVVSSNSFQGLGLAALVILFVMAATSHDFWLHNLTPAVWKRLHMTVYVAYALLVAHVTFGVLQSETAAVYVVLVALGATTLVALHLASSLHSRDREGLDARPRIADIPNNRAITIQHGRERVAIFRYDDTKIAAVSNVCRHQGGPLGEGKIVDGCITCPWHGYQYRPEDGCSPPPFTDRIDTYRTRIENGRVLIEGKHEG